MLKFLYQPYKWLFFAVFFVLNTLFFATMILLTAGFSKWFANIILARWWARLTLLFTPAMVRVEGGENIKKDQSYIVVANHASNYDILAIYAMLDVDIRWVMKQELRKIPVFGAACAAMGHIYINRGNTQAAVDSLGRAKAQLTDGVSVLFFPEGTRGDGKSLLRFKKGAFVMAKDVDLPILPVTIRRTEKIMPNNTLDVMPGVAELIIHPAISVEEVRAHNAEELSVMSQQVIASATTDAVAQSV